MANIKRVPFTSVVSDGNQVITIPAGSTTHTVPAALYGNSLVGIAVDDFTGTSLTFRTSVDDVVYWDKTFLNGTPYMLSIQDGQVIEEIGYAFLGTAWLYVIAGTAQAQDARITLLMRPV